jgi:hypothetical protein
MGTQDTEQQQWAHKTQNDNNEHTRHRTTTMGTQERRKRAQKRQQIKLKRWATKILPKAEGEHRCIPKDKQFMHLILIESKRVVLETTMRIVYKVQLVINSTCSGPLECPICSYLTVLLFKSLYKKLPTVVYVTSLYKHVVYCGLGTRPSTNTLSTVV